jgi:hypothetical protein
MPSPAAAPNPEVAPVPLGPQLLPSPIGFVPSPALDTPPQSSSVPLLTLPPRPRTPRPLQILK